MSNLIHQPSVTAVVLGVGGLIPFVGLSGLSVLSSDTHQQTFLFCLLAYGATIISFLGAIHWGLTMQETPPQKLRLVWGVIPSLAAWLSLIVNTHWGLALDCVVLWVCFWVDCQTYPTFNLTEWLKLRFGLTLIASLSLSMPLVMGIAL